MRKARVAPSLLSCDLGHVEDEVRSVEAAGADLLHFDVMDGHFVPNLTFGPGLCAAVRHITKLPLDVHLMVTNPDDLLEPFVQAGANRIAVHVEVAPNLHRSLTHIRSLGAQPGVALNPSTPVSALEEVWPFVHFILVMTVNPGFGGQHLIPEMLEKIARMRAARDQCGAAVELVVDGGVEPRNAKQFRDLGVDILVAGTAVFGAADRRRAIAALRGEDA
jgi:ribulose-phosphate 3-epimerase